MQAPKVWLLPVILIAMTSAVGAQPASPKKADPLDPAASVPLAAYRSTLSNYQRHSEQPLGSWKEANETVNRIGGWRVYAREATQPDASAAPASAPAAMPAKPASAAGHPGHKTN
jgi:hypothetical protein